MEETDGPLFVGWTVLWGVFEGVRAGGESSWSLHLEHWEERQVTDVGGIVDSACRLVLSELVEKRRGFTRLGFQVGPQVWVECRVFKTWTGIQSCWAFVRASAAGYNTFFQVYFLKRCLQNSLWRQSMRKEVQVQRRHTSTKADYRAPSRVWFFSLPPLDLQLFRVKVHCIPRERQGWYFFLWYGHRPAFRTKQNCCGFLYFVLKALFYGWRMEFGQEIG